MKKEKEKTWLRRKRDWLLPLLVIACAHCQVQTEPGRNPLQRRQVIELAINLAGIPYRSGGIDVDGFDCSGLVFYVFDCFGVKVPRNAREQGRMPVTVTRVHAAPGDILVFKFKGTWHSAIYLGEGRFIHAPSAGGWVRTEELNEYWQSHLRKVVTVWPRTR